MEFPSPCGDVVLKSVDEDWNGCHWDNVSVPLRGCGFENYKRYGIPSKAQLGFRPLAGMWF